MTKYSTHPNSILTLLQYSNLNQLYSYYSHLQAKVCTTGTIKIFLWLQQSLCINISPSQLLYSICLKNKLSAIKMCWALCCLFSVNDQDAPICCGEMRSAACSGFPLQLLGNHMLALTSEIKRLFVHVICIFLTTNGQKRQKKVREMHSK